MKLGRTKQCEKCPWRKDVDPHDIPNGYSVERHKALSSTINSGMDTLSGDLHIMACHELHETPCIGWLVNQIGPGNNFGLRMQMSKCENFDRIELVGEQHETFEDTLPPEA